MRGTACQRWREGGRPSWRRPEEGGFDSRCYGVAALQEADAKRFVTRWHYSGSYPATRLRYGMYVVGGPEPVLVGVAVLSVPASKRVLTRVFPELEPYAESLELGRFVLDDVVPANGESWFLGEIHRLAAADAGLRGVVAFSDPIARYTADGTIVKPGHLGIIYQATNATYTGRGTKRRLTLLRDGRVFSDRAAQKVRKQERGHEYAERRLIAMGARPMRASQSPAVWLAEALDDVGARRVSHPGNHRYAFRVGSRRQRAAVRIAMEPVPYPKAEAA